MPIAFVDRPPTAREFERFRLILSTYQDGSGMLSRSGGRTLPGWRDFERSIALAFNGYAPENKAVFDIEFPDPSGAGVNFGLSCKMRSELNRLDKDGRVTIELSNSEGKFWDQLRARGFDRTNYKSYPADVGASLIELVKQWHFQASLKSGGNFDLAKSFYLALSWNKDEWYQLHQFALELPNPSSLRWYFPQSRKKDIQELAKHLNGDDETGTIFEWYGESGGQLKYYPLAQTAIWASKRFRLEPLPERTADVLKAQVYFPELWARASRSKQAPPKPMERRRHKS